MDVLSFFGVILSIGSILIGQYLEGGHYIQLLNFPAFLIVFGGTFGATMLETPITSLKHALMITHWVLFPPIYNIYDRINAIVKWGQISRKTGLLGLEAMIEDEQDPFVKKGLQLLVDGGEPKVIRRILELELDNKLNYEMQAIKVYESMGGYCPTIGILGAVVGLIQVMNNLSDPSKLGAGIAVAFVATVYGVGLANILFIPMAKKLQKVIMQKSILSEVTIEGLIGISVGENPRMIEMKLLGFINDK